MGVLDKEKAAVRDNYVSNVERFFRFTTKSWGRRGFAMSKSEAAGVPSIGPRSRRRFSRAESRPEYPAELPRHVTAITPERRPAHPQTDRSPGRDRRVGRPRTTLPERPGGEARMRDHHSQPAFGRDSPAGPVHRAARVRSWSNGADKCGRCRSRRPRKALVTYLEKPEMDALLATPNMMTAQGCRDHLAGRASEAAPVLGKAGVGGSAGDAHCPDEAARTGGSWSSLAPSFRHRPCTPTRTSSRSKRSFHVATSHFDSAPRRPCRNRLTVGEVVSRPKPWSWTSRPVRA